MRMITAAIGEDSLVSISGSGAGFAAEHNAALLCVDLGGELSAPDVTFYCFAFDPYDLGKRIVSNNIYGIPGDSPAYRNGNKLYCPLPEALTATGELTVQVEAHWVENSVTKRIAKSGIFNLSFEPSVSGDDEVFEKDCSLSGRLQAVIAEAEGFGGTVSLCTPEQYAAMQYKNPRRFYLVWEGEQGDVEIPPEDPDIPDEGDDPPEESVAVTGIGLNKTSLNLTQGESETLIATVYPANADNKAVIWSSSAPLIAEVSSGGQVNALGAGNAVITATTAEGSFTANCSVAVAAASLPGLWQGSKTANGITANISGNRVTLNGTKNTQQSTGGGGYLTDNLVNLFDVPPVWQTFPAGTQIRIVVSNQSGSTNCNPVNAACVLRKTDNTILAGATWGTPTGTFNYTCTANTPVYGLLFYMQAGETVSNYAFDVEFWVNDVRRI